ncbi:MAG: hypothetical protein Kow0032_28360 [Methyloligellaceae bacterium]
MIAGAGRPAQLQFSSPFAAREAGHPSPQAGSIDQTPDHREGRASGLSPERRVQPVQNAEKPRDPGKGTKANGEPLSEEEQRQVQKLKETDAKVRAHEQAHAIVGGPYASAPSYEYTTGPDGKRYATAGEVQIDVSPEDDPEATIRKMDVVIRAALAPADPSPQDLQVARQAQTQRARARVELTRQREAERNQAHEAPPGAGGGTGATARALGAAQASAAYAQQGSAAPVPGHFQSIA